MDVANLDRRIKMRLRGLGVIAIVFKAADAIEIQSL